MYFAIIWKNKEISLKELNFIKAKDIVEISNILIKFETDFPELLDNLWWIIKRGEIIDENELEQELLWKKILGTKEKELWLQLKKKYKIKRFKLVDRLKTDIEVKNKWIEIIRFQNEFGVVKWYQNIRFYEKIDFEKPGRSMKMGMMPAKLAHIMLNIWLWLFSKDEKPVIFDPFAGSGTTGFIANYLWYDFLWSDIDINYLVENQKWRENQKEKNDKEFEVFQHDISSKFTNINKEKILIVSEWRLWPIVTEKTNQKDIEKYQKKVLNLYEDFLNTISILKKYTQLKAVFTIPYYIKQNNFLEENIKTLSQENNWNFSSIDEIYSREKQKVARKIIILE